MKKIKLITLLSTSAVLLAACADDAPDKKFSEEELAELEIEKEMNKLSGNKDEEFEINQKTKVYAAESFNLGLILSEEGLKVGNNTIDYTKVKNGLEIEWAESAKKIILTETLQKKFGDKKVDKMKEDIKYYLYDGVEISDEELTEKAVLSLEYQELVKVEDETVEEYYDFYYIDRVYRGLVDLPKYEGNEEFYKVKYIVEEAMVMPIDYAEYTKKAKFGKNYTWLKEMIIDEAIESSVPVEMKDDEVVFEIEGTKVKVKELAKRVFAENLVNLYMDAKKHEVYAKAVEGLEIADLEKNNNSLSAIGLQVTAKEINEMVYYVKKAEELEILDKEKFNIYYEDKRVQYGDAIASDIYVMNFYKMEFLNSNLTEEQYGKIQNEIINTEVKVSNEKVEEFLKQELELEEWVSEN